MFNISLILLSLIFYIDEDKASGVMVCYWAVTAADKTMTSSSSFQPHSQSAGLTHRPVSHTHDNGIRAMPAGTPLSPIVYQSPGYSVPTQQHAGHSLPAGTQPTYAAQRFRVPLISLLTARLGNKVREEHWHVDHVRHFGSDAAALVKPQISLSLPLSPRFNGHFPGEPGLAGVYWSKGWWRWW